MISAAIHLVAVLVPALRPVFRTFPMDHSEWLLVLGLSFAIIPAVEFMKAIHAIASSVNGVAANASSLVGISRRGSSSCRAAARADGIAIRPDLLKPGEIELDGIPREWPAAMTAAR